MVVMLVVLQVVMLAVLQVVMLVAVLQEVMLVAVLQEVVRHKRMWPWRRQLSNHSKRRIGVL